MTCAKAAGAPNGAANAAPAKKAARKAVEKREVGNVVGGDRNMAEILTPALDRPSICGKMRRFSHPASGLWARLRQARGAGHSSHTLLL
jgi:hypothetical protein